MADVEFQQYQTYFHTVRRLLLFVGLWPPKWGAFQRFWLVLNFFCCLVMCCTILNFSRSHLTNLSLSTRGMSIGVSFGAVLLKMTCFVYHRDNILRMHETLDTYFAEELSNVRMRSVILRHIGVFKHPSFGFFIAMCGLCSFYCVAPAISLMIQRANDVDPVNYHLVMPARYPWMVNGGGVLYSFHYVFESCATISLSVVTIAVDGLFGVYVFQMIGILCAMGHRMENLGGTDDHRSAIRECVRRHQALARCRDSLERVYGPAVMYIIVTSSVIICALIFQVSLMGRNLSVGKMVFFALYISMKMLQTLIYAWYGSILTTESENFCQAVYASDWPSARDKRFASDVLIIMSQKPLVLTACSLSKISMDMFLAVSNTALSYFFLLQTLEEKA